MSSGLRGVLGRRHGLRDLLGRGVGRLRRTFILVVRVLFVLFVLQHVLRGGQHVPVMQECVLSAADIDKRGLKGRLQILDSAFENRTDELVTVRAFHEKVLQYTILDDGDADLHFFVID